MGRGNRLFFFREGTEAMIKMNTIGGWRIF
jgi:hypothetical protein